jgi:hypothetical protein
VWNDLYNQLDSSTTTLRNAMLETKLVRGTEMINQKLGGISKRCDQAETRVGCLKVSQYKISDLYAILAGEWLDEYLYTNNGIITTPQLQETQLAIRQFLQEATLLSEKSAKNLQELRQIWLYSDGSKENSGFDIMDDLEKIHAILFSSPIAYEGTTNKWSASIFDILARKYTQAPQLGSPENPNPNIKISAPNQENLSGTGKGVIVPEQHSTITQGENMCTPWNTRSAELNSAIHNTSKDSSYTSNMQSSRAETLDYLASTLGIKWMNSLGTSALAYWLPAALMSKFPCGQIFCIRIRFTSYESKLVGGNNKSIEGILDKNLKITNEFAGSNFSQSAMTNQFWTTGTKWNLPAMANIWVKVSSRTPPFLEKVEGDGGKKSNDTKSAEKEGKKILEQSFKNAWLDMKRKNKISGNCFEYTLSQLNRIEGAQTMKTAFSTTQCTWLVEGSIAVWETHSLATAMEVIKKSKMGPMTNNFRMLSSFSSTIADEIGNYEILLWNMQHKKPN